MIWYDDTFRIRASAQSLSSLWLLGRKSRARRRRRMKVLGFNMGGPSILKYVEHTPRPPGGSKK